ncbi:type I polyketide synthase, partial [Streptomyces sp. NPDC058534]|uniref:type I polyketide synthase n=1 Tax=Streptomyces sp. NPDC058534 TaxID=3346541 RepID=UPI003653DAF2
EHYWIQMTGADTDVASVGLASTDHPLLGAVVELPQSDGLVFTSRLSLRTHPWLADHAIQGSVVIPGTIYVDLAIRAGDEFGCGVLDELVIGAPLVLPEDEAVRVQVAVGGADEFGRRTVGVYASRGDAGEGGGQEWTRHASGVLSPVAPASAGTRFDFAQWPPAGAEPVDINGFYEDLTERGYAYGPAFQGLRAVWRRGEELFAEAALPREPREDAGRFGLHPALLDAALHTNAFVAREDDGRNVLPFAWNGVVLQAAGASALRVRVAPCGPDALSFDAADESGAVVLTMDSLVSRPVSVEQLDAAGAGTGVDSLFGLEWAELSGVSVSGGGDAPVAVTDAEDVASLGGIPSVAVLEAVDGGEAVDLLGRVLGVLQSWLVAPGYEESPLVVVTRGAVPAGGSGVSDVAGAAVWGLVRAAQAEYPDRIVLLDVEPGVEVGSGFVSDVLAAGELQLAVRGGMVSVPRLARAVAGAGQERVFDPEGSVLITGGTGSLAGVLARHLVSAHGVRHLVLASRRGAAAEGAAELVAELAAEGATATVVACDVSQREAVAELLSTLTAERRLTGVIHTAGVLDDGVLASLTDERLAGVFAPKAMAARYLDELTRGLDLDAFVVFS